MPFWSNHRERRVDAAALLSGERARGLVGAVARGPAMSVLAGAAVAGASVAAYTSLVEPYWLDVTRHEVALDRLPPALDGLRVAQLSDFHVPGPLESRDAVVQAIARCNEERPDLVVLTGDYLGKARALEPFARALAELRVRPAFAVFGNHDYRYGPRYRRRLEGVFREQGIDLLDNRAVPYERAGARLWLVGIGDGYTSHDRLKEALGGLGPADRPRLLLTHYPDLLFDLPEGEFDLALAGHTHGGQIALPFLVDRALAHSHTVFASGTYRVRGMRLYVSRGLGTSGYRLRLFARPELPLLVLRKGRG